MRLVALSVDPALGNPQRVTPGGQSHGRSITGIQCDRLGRQPQSFFIAFPSHNKCLRQGAKEVIVCVQIGGRLAPRALDFRGSKFWLDRTNDAFRDLILQIEDIVESAVIPAGPHMPVINAID